jgi:hypothetical protein
MGIISYKQSVHGQQNYLLLLIMCVFRDKNCEALVVDATLLKEPLEFLLRVKIGRFELGGTYFECPPSTTNKKRKTR